MNSADYDVGFETGKEESRIIFENTVLPQRVKQAISANNKKWVEGIEAFDCKRQCVLGCKDVLFSKYCLWWQQLKKDMGVEG